MLQPIFRAHVRRRAVRGGMLWHVRWAERHRRVRVSARERDALELRRLVRADRRGLSAVREWEHMRRKPVRVRLGPTGKPVHHSRVSGIRGGDQLEQLQRQRAVRGRGVRVRGRLHGHGLLAAIGDDTDDGAVNVIGDIDGGHCGNCRVSAGGGGRCGDHWRDYPSKTNAGCTEQHVRKD